MDDTDADGATGIRPQCRLLEKKYPYLKIVGTEKDMARFDYVIQI